jgi:hypothetical protein
MVAHAAIEPADDPLDVSNIAITVNPATVGYTVDTPSLTTLAAGGDKTITVSFKPQSKILRPGTGIEPADDPLDLGYVAVGQSTIGSTGTPAADAAPPIDAAVAVDASPAVDARSPGPAAVRPDAAPAVRKVTRPRPAPRGSDDDLSNSRL